MELKRFGIDVVVVQPGFVSTEIDVTGDMTANGGAVADYVALEHEVTAYLEVQDQSRRDARGRRCQRGPREPHTAPEGALRDATTRRPGPRNAHRAPTRLTDRLKPRLVHAAT